jgi:hypothetical protein
MPPISAGVRTPERHNKDATDATTRFKERKLR